MSYEMDAAATHRLNEYFQLIGTQLKDRRKRESFAIYAMGILGEGERKSAEPIAARICGDPGETKRMHEKLLHFLARATWSDRAVRECAAKYITEVIGKREEISTWIIDDTGFLKKGNHSVGVQRQYTGTAGKITNCQVGVSLCVATSTTHVPIDFELYLPESWANDQERRRAVHIPDAVQFKTKPELALEMIERAIEAGIPGRIILADSAYGDCATFRNTVRMLGFDYAMGIKQGTKVVLVDDDSTVHGPSLTVAALAKSLSPRSYRHITWRVGSKAAIGSRFAVVRVKTTHERHVPIEQRVAEWLIIEWPEGEDAPTQYSLSTLPERTTKKALVRILKERWRTEQMYAELKGELGLDHFEGRSFPGWHHHVSVVICCAAFIMAERCRFFSSSRRRPRTSGSHTVAA
jgi:SRSO17 transposase